MKKTIKQENKRNIIHSDYINDNMVLECVYNEEKDSVTIGIRYIKENSIHETIFTTVSMGEYMESFSELIRVSEKSDTIAIFKKIGTDFELNSIYDINEQSMIPEDFKEIVFKQKFPKLELGRNLVLRKKNDGGAVYWQA